MRNRWRTWFLAAMAPSGLSACLIWPTFDEWDLAIGTNGAYPYAVGAEVVLHVYFTKGCSAELLYIGNGHTCLDSSEEDGDLDVTASVSDTSVFSVAVAGNKIRLGILGDGAATSRVDATNSHGDQRSGSVVLKAETPTAVSTSGSASFSQLSYAEKYGHAEGTYTMTAPGTFGMSSATVPGFSLTGGAYDCQALTGITFTVVDQGASNVQFDLAHMVGDDVVCSGAAGCPITVTVETPDVCGITWIPEDVTQVQLQGKNWAHRHAAGTCRLSAALDGTPFTATLEHVFE